MAQQDAFNAAAFAFTGHFAVHGAMLQQTDPEVAQQVRVDVWRMLGTAQGKQLKEQAGLEGDVDIDTAFKIMLAIISNLGMEVEVLERSPARISFDTGGCPIYVGARQAGWEHDAVAAVCPTDAMAFLDAAAKQLNPKLSWRMASFRKSPDEGCVEELVLEA